MKPTVCFQCNKSFKKPLSDQIKCPDCSNLCYQVHSNFSPPPKNDQKAWELCGFLIKKGFDFSGWVKKRGSQDSKLYRPGYPQNTREAKKFIEDWEPNIQKK
jgi:hypothetical protein